MKKELKLGIFVFLFGIICFSCSNRDLKIVNDLTTKIAFGSCGHEDHDLPIFNKIVNHHPDLFIFLGDNIYGDTKDMNVLKAKYRQLADKSSFQNLKSNVPLLAIWDDHDYGWNDIGRHYTFKEESKNIFLEFFDESADSDRRKHEGVYHSVYDTINGKILQIILLDGRTFRDDLKRYGGEFDEDRRYFYNLDYTPHLSSDSTILGETQWKWLEAELEKKADVRLICSGTQFGIEYNGYESWANFPHEQQKMLNLIKRKKASGVIFLSGDVHYSELSKIETDFYPIYDFTSSGLSSTWKFATPNANRIEGPIMENHFAMMTIDWNEEPVSIKMETWDIRDNQRIEYTINLSELQFK